MRETAKIRPRASVNFSAMLKVTMDRKVKQDLEAIAELRTYKYGLCHRLFRFV